ncbi:hypothetical protein VTO73DRAFT_10954 [Trametes versicolor]
MSVSLYTHCLRGADPAAQTPSSTPSRGRRRAQGGRRRDRRSQDGDECPVPASTSAPFYPRLLQGGLSAAQLTPCIRRSTYPPAARAPSPRHILRVRVRIRDLHPAVSISPTRSPSLPPLDRTSPT